MDGHSASLPRKGIMQGDMVTLLPNLLETQPFQCIDDLFPCYPTFAFTFVAVISV